MQYYRLVVKNLDALAEEIVFVFPSTTWDKVIEKILPEGKIISCKKLKRKALRCAFLAGKKFIEEKGDSKDNILAAGWNVLGTSEKQKKIEGHNKYVIVKSKAWI